MSIVVATLVLAPSVVPGAMSILASFIALLALITSIITIKSGNVFYFKITAIISAIGIFIVNDGLRLYGSLPQTPLLYKLSVYGVFIIICALASLYAKKRIGVMKN
jgi:hypothetical protein